MFLIFISIGVGKERNTNYMLCFFYLIGYAWVCVFVSLCVFNCCNECKWKILDRVIKKVTSFNYHIFIIIFIYYNKIKILKRKKTTWVNIVDLSFLQIIAKKNKKRLFFMYKNNSNNNTKYYNTKMHGKLFYF